VAELVDAADSKSVAGNGVPVRLGPGASVLEHICLDVQFNANTVSANLIASRRPFGYFRQGMGQARASSQVRSSHSSGRLSRAVRLIAERTARNAAELAPEPHKRRYSRSKTVLELLEQRGSITVEHRRAGERLERDYRDSQTNPARLVSRYEAKMPKPPKRYRGNADTPASIRARERFDAAMQVVGPWLSGIVVHTAICDLPVTEWGPLNGRAQSHGLPVLLVALDALCADYGERRRTA
jgi:hypothetical protein